MIFARDFADYFALDFTKARLALAIQRAKVAAAAPK